MGLANLFSTTLDIEPRLFQPIEQKGGVGLHDLFRLVDFGHGALEGLPAHPLGLCDVIADAILCPKLATKLESASQSPFMGGFALAGICEPVGPARRERECAIGQVELRRPYACPWAYKPPALAAEGLGRGHKLDPVIGFTSLPIPPACRVSEPHASGFPAEMGFVADRGGSLAGLGVRPYDRAGPRTFGPIAEQGR
jgi:hypothetical protein